MGDYFDIDCSSLIKELVRINNWDDYEIFEKKYFNSDLWPEKNEDEFLKELLIEPVCVEGNVWKHVTDNYDLPDEYRFAFELCQNYIFKKWNVKHGWRTGAPREDTVYTVICGQRIRHLIIVHFAIIICSQCIKTCFHEVTQMVA